MQTTCQTDHQTENTPFLAGIAAALDRSLERGAQMHEINRLSALSDADLARMDLHRGAIAAQVMRSRFCY